MDRSFVIAEKEFNQKFGGLEPFGKFLEDAIAFNCDMYGGGNVRCEVSDWGAEFFFTGSPFDDDATDELILRATFVDDKIEFTFPRRWVGALTRESTGIFLNFLEEQLEENINNDPHDWVLVYHELPLDHDVYDVNLDLGK